MMMPIREILVYLLICLIDLVSSNSCLLLPLISLLICRKMLIPLPLGLVHLGRYYQLLTSFSFVSVGQGVKLADALDGLAGGTAALAFTGMSIAVLPICSGE